MSGLLVLHVLAVGVWLGCLATEIAFERGIDRLGEVERRYISALHDTVDRWVEGPAFVVTLLSGGGLLVSAVPSPALWAKIGLGLAAVLLNVWCLRLVFDRAAAAHDDRHDDWRRIDRLQHRVGGLVTLFLIAAVIVALVRAFT